MEKLIIVAYVFLVSAFCISAIVLIYALIKDSFKKRSESKQKQKQKRYESFKNSYDVKFSNKSR